MSPTNTTSLILAVNFDPQKFYDDDMKLTISIREAKVFLEEAKARYDFLFVNQPVVPTAQ